MSWPCIIGFRRKNGDTIGCYVNANGSPGEAGETLLNCYNNPLKAAELIKEGDKAELNIKVAPDDVIKQIRSEIVLNQKQFHFFENGSVLSDYYYFIYRLWFEEYNVPDVNRDTLEPTRAKYKGLENLLKMEYESIYIFDETKNCWLIGIGKNGGAWFIGEDHACNFVSLEKYLKTKDSESEPIKPTFESDYFKRVQGIKQRCLKQEQLFKQREQYLNEFKKNGSYEKIGPRKLVEYINKELDEKTTGRDDHNFQKYSYYNGMFSIKLFRSNENEWITKFSDNNPLVLINITNGSDLNGSAKLFKSYELALVYCKQNNMIVDEREIKRKANSKFGF